MAGWGCPHEIKGKCARVCELPCDPGMKGCILFGRFVFSDETKNRPDGPRRRRPPAGQRNKSRREGE